MTRAKAKAKRKPSHLKQLQGLKKSFDVATSSTPLNSSQAPLPLSTYAWYQDFRKRTAGRTPQNPAGQTWVLKLMFGGPQHNHKAYGKNLDFKFKRKEAGTIRLDINDIDTPYNGDWYFFAPRLQMPNGAVMQCAPIKIVRVGNGAEPPEGEFGWRFDIPKKDAAQKMLSKVLYVDNANSFKASYKYTLFLATPDMELPLELFDPIIENEDDH